MGISITLIYLNYVKSQDVGEKPPPPVPKQSQDIKKASKEQNNHTEEVPPCCRRRGFFAGTSGGSPRFWRWRNESDLRLQQLMRGTFDGRLIFLFFVEMLKKTFDPSRGISWHWFSVKSFYFWNKECCNKSPVSVFWWCNRQTWDLHSPPK